MSARKPKKVILAILDGWGIGEESKFNAIANAKTPNMDRLERDYPNVRLKADGAAVGLPEGQFGTSEINHQVIGTGIVMKQDLPRIDDAIKDETFFANTELVDLMKSTAESNKSVHLVGVISDGKVHASLEHVQALIKLAYQEEVKRVFVHAFTDGRDTPPQSAEKYLTKIQETLDNYKFEQAAVATVQGRFFLDRDRDWERTAQAVNLLTKGEGKHYKGWQEVINYYYNQKTTDEFLPQCIIREDGVVNQGDGVVMFHFRTDRAYQLLKSLMEAEPAASYVSFTKISDEFDIPVAFPRLEITHTLAKTLSDAGKKQLHITETEKFAHLTFFMNAGKETEFKGEDWQMVKSNRFVKPYYNFEPSMQAFSITEKVIEAIEKDKYDFIVINFPNADMVGHTGNYEAAVIAAESVDFAVGKLYEALEDKLNEYALLVTADHGNADIMWDEEAKQPHTQHTTNPVPFILVSDNKQRLDRGETLVDLAPTILDLMGIEQPEAMQGESLLDL